MFYPFRNLTKNIKYSLARECFLWNKICTAFLESINQPLWSLSFKWAWISFLKPASWLAKIHTSVYNVSSFSKTFQTQSLVMWYPCPINPYSKMQHKCNLSKMQERLNQNQLPWIYFEVANGLSILLDLKIDILNCISNGGEWRIFVWVLKAEKGSNQTQRLNMWRLGVRMRLQPASLVASALKE